MCTHPWKVTAKDACMKLTYIKVSGDEGSQLGAMPQGRKHIKYSAWTHVSDSQNVRIGSVAHIKECQSSG